jgi:hypothetical protein
LLEWRRVVRHAITTRTEVELDIIVVARWRWRRGAGASGTISPQERVYLRLQRGQLLLHWRCRGAKQQCKG